MWVHDPNGIEPHSSATPAPAHEGALRVARLAPCELGFDALDGRDVAIATGWETVYPVLRLPGCRARAYFVQDHEPEFFATSSESVLAERTYRAGLPCIASSRWLAQVLRDRYGADATAFEFGVDPASTTRWPTCPRRRDTVLFYARDHTPRRAVALGLLALQLLLERRPEPAGRARSARTAGSGRPSPSSSSAWRAGPSRRLYNEATVGLCLSLTNHSLIAQEMLACGLPVVELAGRALRVVLRRRRLGDHARRGRPE